MFLHRLALVAALAAALAAPAHADEGRMSNGAGTLSEGIAALGLNLGFDLPEPVVVGLRLDYGVTNRLQLGASASTAVLVSTVTGHARWQLLALDGGRHFLGIEGDVGYLNVQDLFDIDDIDALTLRPALAYELRPWESRRTGFFVKAGSFHVRAEETVSWGDALGNQDDEQWAHLLRLSAGVQQQLGDHFSLALQASLHLPEPFPFGKLSLSYAF